MSRWQISSLPLLTIWPRRTHPVLIQGETSVGKTSLIRWLAAATGNQCVRINNHEHTDIQEYIGCYSSDNRGKLVFKEGTSTHANLFWKRFTFIRPLHSISNLYVLVRCDLNKIKAISKVKNRIDMKLKMDHDMINISKSDYHLLWKLGFVANWGECGDHPCSSCIVLFRMDNKSCVESQTS